MLTGTDSSQPAFDPGATVLVTDDNEAGRYAMAKCLRSAGLQVLEAGEGRQCLRLAREHPLDLVILDVQLPDVNGVDVCRQLKTDPLTAHTPVIQISAHFTQSNDRVHGLDSGADAYLTAPFEPRELLAQVRAMLRIRQAETQLRHARDDLEKIVQERTARLKELVSELEFLSYTLAHDMRAPLRAMRGFAEMHQQLCSECKAEQQLGLLHRIISSADRMDKLITGALDYTTAIHQGVPLAPVPLGPLLTDMLRCYPEFLPENADIRLELPLPTVLGNEPGLIQCFSNLLNNAIKFVKPGAKPKVRIYAQPVSPAADGPQRMVRIWVEDDGIGVDPQLLPRIFDLFARGPHAKEGAGIGLALVRKVIERMGGRVGVESQPNHGSRFWLELELAPAP